jgi:type IV pilus assembly protein PilY1
MRFAVQLLTGTATTPNSTCKALIDDLDFIDSKITNPTFKAPSNANYGAAYYEIFKYFGAHSNPTLAPNAAPNGGSPVGRLVYGPIRCLKPQHAGRSESLHERGSDHVPEPHHSVQCLREHYIVLVGNTYPNAEANNGGPTIFANANLGYTLRPFHR